MKRCSQRECWRPGQYFFVKFAIITKLCYRYKLQQIFAFSWMWKVVMDYCIFLLANKFSKFMSDSYVNKT